MRRQRILARRDDGAIIAVHPMQRQQTLTRRDDGAVVIHPSAYIHFRSLQAEQVPTPSTPPSRQQHDDPQSSEPVLAASASVQPVPSPGVPVRTWHYDGDVWSTVVQLVKEAFVRAPEQTLVCTDDTGLVERMQAEMEGPFDFDASFSGTVSVVRKQRFETTKKCSKTEAKALKDHSRWPTVSFFELFCSFPFCFQVIVIIGAEKVLSSPGWRVSGGALQLASTKMCACFHSFAFPVVVCVAFFWLAWSRVVSFLFSRSLVTKTKVSLPPLFSKYFQ